MKIALQHRKPTTWHYTLGVGGLFVGVFGIIAIVLFNYKIYFLPSEVYAYLLQLTGPGIVLACAFLPKKMLVITIGAKKCTMHYERRLLFIKIPMPKKTLPQIDYVCAFQQLQSDSDNEGNTWYSYTYDVNAWYGNKHIKLCNQDNAEEAMRVATELAIAFNCELFDATNPDDKKWVELPVKHNPALDLFH